MNLLLVYWINVADHVQFALLVVGVIFACVSFVSVLEETGKARLFLCLAIITIVVAALLPNNRATCAMLAQSNTPCVSQLVKEKP